VGNAQFGEPGRSRREFITVAARERDVIEPGAALVEFLVVRFPVGVQAE
jgi:hypothetical protein